jgi:predicted nucleic acid-binding Zn ribbon protein
VVRVFSKNIGLVFKGTGFYQTDYTKKSASPPEKSEPAASACGTSACACAADTKAS